MGGTLKRGLGVLLSSLQSASVVKLSSHSVLSISLVLWLIDKFHNYQVIACISVVLRNTRNSSVCINSLLSIIGKYVC